MELFFVFLECFDCGGRNAAVHSYNISTSYEQDHTWKDKFLNCFKWILY